VAEQNIIRITPDSELARFLDAGGETPVFLEKNGKRYLLVEEPAVDLAAGLHARYDLESVQAAIRNTTGSWSDIDPDAFIADLYQAREDGSRPATRP
jgi:hypothetical protein